VKNKAPLLSVTKARRGFAVRSGGNEDYTAYAVRTDNSRHRIKARQIIIELGGREVFIDLFAALPSLVNCLRIRTEHSMLMINGACGNIIDVSIEDLFVGPVAAAGDSEVDTPTQERVESPKKAKTRRK
jgi:hypothetical protein